MRLIDADALEKELCHGCQYEKHKYSNCIDCAIAQAPTIKPQQKTGKWIKLYAGNYKCSECGDWWGFVDDYDSNEESEIRSYIHLLEDFKYCPSCGAQMTKGGSDG